MPSRRSRLNRCCALLAALGLVAACTSESASPPTGLRVELVRAPAAGTAGELLPEPVQVRVIDDQGRGVPGVPLRWEAAAGELVTRSDTSARDGYASAQWRLPLLPGAHTLGVTLSDAPALRIEAVAQAFRVDQLEMGFRGACGLRAGDLWCWGRTLETLLDTLPYSLPTPGRLSAGLGLREVATSLGFVCVLDAASRLRCRGSRSVATVPPLAQTELALVEGMPPLRGLADGNGPIVCGLAVADDTAWCVQFAGSASMVGFPPGVAQVSPTQRFRQLGVGFWYACGLDFDGRAWCWGYNGYGALGDGTNTDAATPVPVATAARFVELSVGGQFACGREADGAVTCWGNWVGPTKPTPSRVPGLVAQRMAAGDYLLLQSADALTEVHPYDGVVRPIPAASALRPSAVVAGGGWCFLDAVGHVFCNGHSVSNDALAQERFEDLLAVAPDVGEE